MPDALAASHPEFARELLDPDVSADVVSAGSRRRVLWRCDTCAHQWRAAVYQRTANHTGCPACANRIPTATNNLAALHADLAGEWADPARAPAEVTGSSEYQALWRCATCGHEWRARVVNRARGSGCPACAVRASRGRKKSTIGIDQTHPQLAAEWADPSGEPQHVTAGSHRSVLWACAQCDHRWQARVDNRARGSSCPACLGRVATSTNNLAALHPELVTDWADTTIGPEQATARSDRRVRWQCRTGNACGHVWEAVIHQRVNGHGCPACAGQIATETNNLSALNPRLRAEWHDPNRQAHEVTGRSSYRARWRCSTCAHEWQATVNARANGSDCPACAGKIATNTNSLATQRPDLAIEWADQTRTPHEVTAGSNYRALWQCRTGPACGHAWIAAVKDRARGRGRCPRCTKQRSTRTAPTPPAPDQARGHARGQG